MLKKIVSIFSRFSQHKKGNDVTIDEVKETKKRNIVERKYRNIPLYTEEEMRNALIDDSDEVRKGCLGRQALNGYVGIYMDKWIVGRRRDGQIIRTSKLLLFECSSMDIEKRNNRILNVQNRALLGEDIQNEMFCKFTYDIKDQNKFAIHVTLEKEYSEDQIMEDSGDYGGIHFVSIDDIKMCTDSINTYYGNKIVLVRPICGEVYYEYIQDVFVGKRVYIEKVMYLDNIKTWEYLSERYTSIKNDKEILCKYLKGLEMIDGKNYMDCIEFLEKL